MGYGEGFLGAIGLALIAVYFSGCGSGSLLGGKYQLKEWVHYATPLETTGSNIDLSLQTIAPTSSSDSPPPYHDSTTDKSLYVWIQARSIPQTLTLTEGILKPTPCDDQSNACHPNDSSPPPKWLYLTAPLTNSNALVFLFSLNKPSLTFNSLKDDTPIRFTLPGSDCDVDGHCSCSVGWKYSALVSISNASTMELIATVTVNTNVGPNTELIFSPTAQDCIPLQRKAEQLTPGQYYAHETFQLTYRHTESQSQSPDDTVLPVDGAMASDYENSGNESNFKTWIKIFHRWQLQ